MSKYTYNGYTLTMRATNKRTQTGQIIVSYKLTAPNGETIFKGANFGASPLHTPAGKKSAGALLSFLTLQEGDTDSEYFENYTPRQLKFREQEAEHLQIWAEELENGGIK